MTIKTILRTEIQREVKKLEGLDAGSQEYKMVIDGIAKLADQLKEFEKIELEKTTKRADLELKEKQFKTENDIREREISLKEKQLTIDKDVHNSDKLLKEKQLKSEKINRWVDVGKTVAQILIPLGFTYWGMCVSFKYEEKGIIPTTNAGKKMLDKLFR